MEFLVRSTTSFPPHLTADHIGELRAQERALALRLRAEGVLTKLWRLPGKQGTLALYEVRDATHLHEILTSLPLFPYLDVEVEALATHPQELLPEVVNLAAAPAGTNGTSRA
ncbi:muconolactone Delta-isomerase family protein [Amycolatopsis sp. NPDC049253]|uniref:muconolactone Delta-isomerase n=1 Tax=Amycolatopsis sp. NPDC049253 TaxID=3155274 RepID=UPI003428A816